MKPFRAGAMLAILALAGSARATPCDQLAAYARKLPDSAWARGDAALAPVLAFDKPRSTASPFESRLAKLPKVRSAIGADSGTETVFIDHLAGTDLYALSTVQGTLHCQTTVFVRARPGGPARPVAGPASSGEADVCWTTSAGFARAFGQPVYVVHDGLFQDVKKASFEIAPWTGAGWGPTCRTELKFRADYALSERHCGDKSVCAAPGDIAKSVALAYNRAREGGNDGAGFRYGPADPVQAATVKAFMAAQDSPSTWTPDFPAFGKDRTDDHPISYSGFALFPLTLDGRSLVGAIGHEGVGWREGANTLFAIYALNHGVLNPLAGFVFKRSLAGLESAKVILARVSK